VNLRVSRSKLRSICFSTGRRPSEEERTLCNRGVVSSRLERPPGYPAEAGRSGSASSPRAPKRPWVLCGPASISPAPKRRWGGRGGLSLEHSAHAEAWVEHSEAACVAIPRARRPSGVPALPKQGGADTAHRFSIRPEGLLESLRCRSIAGPTRAPTHRNGPGPGIAEAIRGVRPRLPVDAMPQRVKRRSAGPSLSLREPKPGAGRGAIPLESHGKPGAWRGPLLVAERARATVPVGGEMEPQS
jgi:hypothetical protein